MRLILLEPGTYQTHPTMGVGIVSRYRFGNIEDINILQSDIENQISMYLPELQGVDVELIPGKELELIIRVNTDENSYNYIFNSQTLTLKILASM